MLVRPHITNMWTDGNIIMSSPPVTAEEARSIASSVFGIDVEAVKSLGSCQDANFRVSDGKQKYVLKVANTDTSLEEIVFQNHVLQHLAALQSSLRTEFPSVHRAVTPECGWGVAKIPLHGAEYFVRLLSYIDGDLYSDFKYKCPETLRAFGTFISHLNQSLARFSGEVVHREVEWDMKYALRNIRQFIGFLADEKERASLLSKAEAMQALVEASSGSFTSQVIHGDLAHYNMLARRLPNKRPEISGVIDFGDVTRGWLVGDIAVALCPLFLEGSLTPVDVTTELLRGFLAGGTTVLNDAEARSLWPLVVLRAIALYVFISKQVACDPTNQYCIDELVGNRKIMESVLSVPHCFATETVLQVCQSSASLLTSGSGVVGSTHALLEGFERTRLDLSVESLDYPDEGSWLTVRPNDLMSSMMKKHECERNSSYSSSKRAYVVGYGEPHLFRTQLRSHSAADSVSLGTLVHLTGVESRSVQLRAPFDCEVVTRAGGLVLLRGASITLGLLGIQPVEGFLKAGQELDVVIDNVLDIDSSTSTQCYWFWAQVIPPAFAEAIATGASDDLPPAYCRGCDRSVWQTLCPDPTGLLFGSAKHSTGSAFRDEQAVVAKRYQYFANVQQHYFTRDAAPVMVRGFKQFLYDQYGRAYLDMVNNVAVAGHSRARITRAATRQLQLLNTNSRFVYEALGNFTEKIISRIPAKYSSKLNVAFLVNSGSEATDLALRLARTVVTERRRKQQNLEALALNRDTVCLVGAYHGVTTASDEVSTTLNDNPRSLETRAPWIHLVPMPNLYRGQHQCAAYGRSTDLTAEALDAAYRTAAAPYADAVDARVDALVAAGQAPAVFIAEPLSGNAGGVEVPPGFLQRVYDKVHSVGGLCIADEVQVGYGRLGTHFWGFEEHGVVPDIITMAKAAGNGHPLGFVVTSREIAEEFGADGSFFSSAGGGPVSCEVGMAVLDLLAEERLQENAHEVGAYLNGRLKALQAKFPHSIGCIHGHGLYQGVELINDEASREPATAMAYAVCERLLTLGVICHNTGDYSNVLKVKPPLCFSREDADFFVSALDKVFSDGF